MIRRDKLDAIFSTLVRERAGFHCEACGKYFPEGQRQGLHCSHFFGRRHKSVRWAPLNAFSHCYACHQRFGESPYAFTRWVEARIGPREMELLTERAHGVVKLTKADKEDIYTHMKAQLEIMKAKRAQGWMGRIEFEDPL